MAKTFNAETALRVVGTSSNVETLPNLKPQGNKFYKDYFSLETGEPIPLEQISKRVKRRFSEIERNSVYSILDLFFIYQNWTGFYSRTDSFTRYIREDLQISKTYAYGVIHSVELLNDYFIHKGNHESDMNGFMEEITSTIESIGVKKLIILSSRKDESKYDVIDRLLDGEKITAESLLQRPQKEKSQKPAAMVSLKDDELKIGDALILTFSSENKILRNAVVKAVEKYYLKVKKVK